MDMKIIISENQLKEIISDLITPDEYTNMVRNLMDSLESLYPVDLFIYYNKFAHTIIVSKIVIDKQNRNKGIGSNVMSTICNLADKHNMRIALTPTNDFGGSKTRLIQFYKKFGFTKYKGFEFKESMVRIPQNTPNIN